MYAKCENDWSNIFKRKEKRDKAQFESDPVSKYIHPEVLPMPMSNSDNIIKDKFRITLGREMIALVSMSRRKEFTILNIRSSSPREIIVQCLSLAINIIQTNRVKDAYLVTLKGRISSKMYKILLTC